MASSISFWVVDLRRPIFFASPASLSGCRLTSPVEDAAEEPRAPVREGTDPDIMFIQAESPDFTDAQRDLVVATLRPRTG